MAEATEKAVTSIKDITVDGYEFKVDTDLLDDVEAFELIDRIENKQQAAAIVTLLKYLVGDKGVADMKAHYTKLDAEEHKDEKDYKPRFRATKLAPIYAAIIEQFDPKD